MTLLLCTKGSCLGLYRFKELENLGVSSERVRFYGYTPERYSKVNGVKDKSLFKKIRDNLVEISRKKKNMKLLFTFNIVCS